MDKFTPEFIAGQLAIAAKATPRPWKFYDAFDIVGKPGVVGSNRLGTDDTTVIGADGYNEIHVIEDDAVYLCAAAKNYPTALAEIERLREALEEIRDLARTGLPPAGWEETYWLFHKSNRIAGMADAALKGQEAEG